MGRLGGGGSFVRSIFVIIIYLFCTLSYERLYKLCILLHFTSWTYNKLLNFQRETFLFFSPNIWKHSKPPPPGLWINWSALKRSFSELQSISPTFSGINQLKTENFHKNITLLILVFLKLILKITFKNNITFFTLIKNFNHFFKTMLRLFLY